MEATLQGPELVKTWLPGASEGSFEAAQIGYGSDPQETALLCCTGSRISLSSTKSL